MAGGTVGVPRARVVLVASSGEKLEASAEGDGMIDAACAAIRAGNRGRGISRRLQRLVGDRRDRRSR